MAQKKIVHIVGTGTIGEPLIGILSTFKEPFGIDEVTFHKRTPLLTDRSKVMVSCKQGRQTRRRQGSLAKVRRHGHDAELRSRRGDRARQRHHRLHAGGQ